MTRTARLSNTFLGDWEVYVVTDAPDALDWPTHRFGRSAPIPTLDQRVEALAALGYAPVGGAEWEWLELSDLGDTRVWLFASLTVRRVDGGAA
ncbi:DUF6303 family protein [Streptomyces sp. NPDC002835]